MYICILYPRSVNPRPSKWDSRTVPYIRKLRIVRSIPATESYTEWKCRIKTIFKFNARAGFEPGSFAPVAEEITARVHKNHCNILVHVAIACKVHLVFQIHWDLHLCRLIHDQMCNLQCYNIVRTEEGKVLGMATVFCCMT
jgi:hypothetical protein